MQERDQLEGRDQVTSESNIQNEKYSKQLIKNYKLPTLNTGTSNPYPGHKFQRPIS